MKFGAVIFFRRFSVVYFNERVVSTINEYVSTIVVT